MDELKLSRQDDLWILTLNRPQKHNALNSVLTQALLDTLQAAAHATDCKAVVLAGNGSSFCAGADTREFAGFRDDTARAIERAATTKALHRAFRDLPQPIIAAVHGNALGGGAGLALACDMVIAARDTRFGFPELKHGICPAIVMANLVRQLNPKAAFELVSTARLLDGSEMADWGLANQVCETPEETMHTAVQVAGTWASCHAPALTTTKQLFYRCAELDFEAALQSGRDTNIIMRQFIRHE